MMNDLLDYIPDGVFTVDQEWRITFFNRAAEQITGIRRDQAIGRRCCDVFRASICESGCALRQTMATRRVVTNKVVYIIDVRGRKIPISISTAVLKNKRGEMVGGVESFRDLRVVEELHREMQMQNACSDIMGHSAPMQRVFQILPAIAESDSTVLISGASGTGKELFARAIHSLSKRRNKRFIAVNCGALPDNLLESELFGYKAGAFTDARKDKPGRFALAEGGTLFLDEIGDISSAMQTRLLRVLQEKVYEPLGGVISVRADVRILAATNKDLKKLVDEGRFREDLFYRIHVVPVELPALRERREDIPTLIDHFILHFNRLRGKAVAGVSNEVLACLMDYDFPGNVRELENIIEHAFVLCQGGVIELRHLPEPLCHFAGGGNVTFSTGPMTLEAMEEKLIIEALQRNKGNKQKAAQDLGINPSTLFRKLKSRKSGV